MEDQPIALAAGADYPLLIPLIGEGASLKPASSEKSIRQLHQSKQF